MLSTARKVLIADDERQIRKVCQAYLDRAGFETIMACDGQEALDRIADVLPDIILLDVVMPKLSGLEVCRIVKSRHDTQHIPVVMMTGMSDPDDIVNGLKAGADDYLCKPLRMAELRVRIENLVRRKQMFETLQSHNDELVRALGSQSNSIVELFTLSMQMNTSPSLNDMLSVLSNSVARALECQRVAVFLPSLKEGVLRVAASTGLPEEVAQSVEAPMQDAMVERAFQRRFPFLVSSADGSDGLLGLTRSQAFAQASQIVVPMVANDDPVGIIVLVDEQRQELTTDDITLLTYMAQAAAVAIKNKLRHLQIRETQDVTIFALAKLAESRDDLTGYHIRRVQTYCRKLAKQLRSSERLGPQLTDAFIDEIWRASPLHDIGKVGIPDNILLKPGRLTPDEFKTMQEHTTIGGLTLAAAEKGIQFDAFLAMAREICFAHHEKWDGSGYPQGLAEDQIPLSARILACADVYDALTTARPYKPPFSHEKARAIIRDGRGTHFDPEIVDAFEQLADEFDKVRAQLQEADGAPEPNVQVVV